MLLSSVGSAIINKTISLQHQVSLQDSPSRPRRYARQGFTKWSILLQYSTAATNFSNLGVVLVKSRCARRLQKNELCTLILTLSRLLLNFLFMMFQRSRHPFISSPHVSRLFCSMGYYNLLGVSKNATKAEIKSAFLSLSKKHHPDLNPTAKSQDAHKKFQEINEAYTILVDPVKRSRYDQQFSGSRPHFTTQPSSSGEQKFDFYKYNAHAGAYTYARAYKYYDMTDAQWEELRKRTSEATSRRRSHFKIIWLLVLLMVSGTILHSCRIYYTHKNQQLKAMEESMKNQEFYEAVRERGRNSTLQQQLHRLTQQQNTNSPAIRKN